MTWAKMVAVSSALLTIALLALWAWSHHRGIIVRPIIVGTDQLSVSNGEVIYWDWELVAPATPHWEDFDAQRDPLTAAWVERELGRPFAFKFGGVAVGQFYDANRHTVVVFPMWLVCLLSGVPLGWWGWKRWRRRQWSRGRGFAVDQRG